MNGDLSRVTFDRLNHYTRVVMQQGRVQLDADFNEQTAILLHYLQTLAADLIGPYGGPRDQFGFKIDIIANADIKVETYPNEGDLSALQRFPLLIQTGRYYVDGRMCELDRPTPFLVQNDLPVPDAFGPDNGIFLAYLDAWEHHFDTLDDPRIHEVALGSADTATREKLVYRVRLIKPQTKLPEKCADLKSEMWTKLLEEIERGPRGSLKAKAREAPEADVSEPCVSSPEARFRGLENQLYRVEIHRGGLATATGSKGATFKWSRDNSSLVGVYQSQVGDEILVPGMRDSQNWFAAGDWVELTHDELELNGQPGVMVQLAAVEGESLRIDRATASADIFVPGSVKNARIRRWNQQETGKSTDSPRLVGGALRLVEGTAEDQWLELEDGIVVQFQASVNAKLPHQYRTGDFWLIPARVATGDVEWPGPQGNPDAVPPRGIDHHYAPLAIVTIAAGLPSAVVDLRLRFEPRGACVP